MFPDNKNSKIPSKRFFALSTGDQPPLSGQIEKKSNLLRSHFVYLYGIISLIPLFPNPNVPNRPLNILFLSGMQQSGIAYRCCTFLHPEELKNNNNNANNQ